MSSENDHLNHILEQFTIPQLKNTCKELQLKGISNKNKPDLIKLLHEYISLFGVNDIISNSNETLLKTILSEVSPDSANVTDVKKELTTLVKKLKAEEFLKKLKVSTLRDCIGIKGSKKPEIRATILNDGKRKAIEKVFCALVKGNPESDIQKLYAKLSLTKIGDKYDEKALLKYVFPMDDSSKSPGTPITEKKEKKRKVSSSEERKEEPKVKKQKLESPKAEPKKKKKKQKKPIKCGITSEELSEYKTKELRAVCKKYNLKDSDEKKDLCQRILMFLTITSVEELTVPKKEFT